MLLNVHVKMSVCFILFAAEGLRGWEGHRGSLQWGSQVQEKEEKEEKSRRGGSSWISGKEKKHKALRIMNETALLLLAHINTVYTVSFMTQGCKCSASRASHAVLQKAAELRHILLLSEWVGFFWPSCILSREPPDLQTRHAVLFFILFLSINPFAEKPEPVAEPPKPSQRKKVRRETWSRAAGPHEAYANDCWLCHMQ